MVLSEWTGCESGIRRVQTAGSPLIRWLIRDKSLGDSNETTMIPFLFREREVSEMPASERLYIQKNVLGGSRLLPIGNKESQRVQKGTPKNNTQSTGMSRKRRRREREKERPAIA